MGDKSGIQWCDATWNPVRGCSKVSPGCKHCYAIKTTHWQAGLSRARGPCKGSLIYQGLTEKRASGLEWTGKIELAPEMLDLPIRWRKPRTIFVNSMSDLFHEGVSFEFIAAVFGVMAAARQHTFKVLTKRPERAAKFFTNIAHNHPPSPWLADSRRPDFRGEVLAAMEHLGRRARPGLMFQRDVSPEWPLPNVELGVSVEDRKHGLPRVDALRTLPAFRRFLSVEPLLEDLGEVDFRGVDQVIVGGESGSKARPCDLKWVRSVVKQARRDGCLIFVKQLGSNPTNHGVSIKAAITDKKGGDISEWAEDLRVREVLA